MKVMIHDDGDTEDAAAEDNDDDEDIEWDKPLCGSEKRQTWSQPPSPPTKEKLQKSTQLTRSSWLNCALRLMRWWSCVLGQYRTVMVGTWRYWITMRR